MNCHAMQCRVLALGNAYDQVSGTTNCYYSVPPVLTLLFSGAICLLWPCVLPSHQVLRASSMDIIKVRNVSFVLLALENVCQV